MIEVLFFQNGNTAVFKDQEQVPELQRSWFLTWIKDVLEPDKSIDLEDVKFILPSGRKANLFKKSDGSWGWEIAYD